LHKKGDITMSKITVLVIKPERKPYIKEIENTLKSLQHEVGGYIQAVYPWEEPVALIVDEESKLKSSPFNRALRDEQGNVYDYIAGTFLIVGLGEEDFASLPPELITHFSEMFAKPEIMLNLGGQIIIAQI
jgi:antirestriction protein